MTNLTLNIVPISFNAETIRIGRIPNIDKQKGRELREKYWQTHAFRYDTRSNELLNIAIQKDQEPIGNIDQVNPYEHLYLIARAVQQSFLVWLANRRPILHNNKKLIFWGQNEDARLLSQALKKVNLSLNPIDDLEVYLRYDIDCRLFRDPNDLLYLGIIIDLATSNVIDIPVSTLIQNGLNIKGRYICKHTNFQEAYLRPKLDLIGQVSEFDTTKVLLINSEGINEISSNEVFLEPRLENLHDVVTLYYGNNANRVISELKNLCNPINSANGKLDRIKQTLTGLKQHPIVIAGSVNIQLGELLTQGDKLFPQKISTKRPSLLFGPQGRKQGEVPDNMISYHGPYMYMQHERNEPLIVVICEKQFQGRIEQFLKQLRDGYSNTQWKRRYPNPFQEGLIGKFRLSKIRFEYEFSDNESSQCYEKAIDKLLNRLDNSPDLAIVQTRKNFQLLYGNENPYFVSKMAFMLRGIPTQSVTIEKVDMFGDSLAYLLNNVALATYAKLDGIPWVISTREPTTHELVVGLGVAEVGNRNRMQSKTRYVGITTVFQGDGRYLLWGLTREVEFEDYPEALLESLKTTVKHVQQNDIWEKGDKVRLVCHVYKRLKDCEVEAIKNLVQELITEEYKVEFAFLDISWWHPYHLFDPSQKGVTRYGKIKGEGIPQRGLCFQLDKFRGLLHLIGPSDIKTDTQGIPQPLLVELHRDSDFTDMTYLLRQIYHFTYMSWRSFFPSSEPVTITYSRLIARLQGNLKTVQGWDNRVLGSVNLRDRRWFL